VKGVLRKLGRGLLQAITWVIVLGRSQSTRFEEANRDVKGIREARQSDCRETRKALGPAAAARVRMHDTVIKIETMIGPCRRPGSRLTPGHRDVGARRVCGLWTCGCARLCREKGERGGRGGSEEGDNTDKHR
jgi:hypothetical protein